MRAGNLEDMSREEGANAGMTHLKTSPNLSATRIVRPERVNRIWVGFFGISLRVAVSHERTKLENLQGTYRSLKSCRLSIAQTFNCLSSPTVTKFVYSMSTAAQRMGPVFCKASSFALSRDTVERSSSPVLRFSSRQVSVGSPRSVL